MGVNRSRVKTKLKAIDYMVGSVFVFALGFGGFGLIQALESLK